MNKKHLFWIIPVTLILGSFIGGYYGYRFGLFSIETLDEMSMRLDNCCIETLSYAQLENKDCNILITGKLKECVYEEDNIENEFKYVELGQEIIS